ncbi:MAG: sensor histidine kinase, partial [Planctomycetota bacterium]
ELAAANVRLRVEIDERRRAEDQARRHQADLVHAGWLTTLGQRVAEIAYDLNQPLSAILTYAQSCLRLTRIDGEHSDEMAASLHQVVTQAVRATEIVRRLRDFSVQAGADHCSADINEIVHDVSQLLESEARLAGVEIRVEADQAMEPIPVDRGQIELVLVNLLRNSFDALRQSERYPRDLVVQTASRGGFGEVKIRDSGSGPPDGDPEQMFARFFTTKPGHVGMGLPISRSIVESHGGKLWFEPTSEPGAAFRFTLPTGDGRSEAGATRAANAEAEREGTA